MWLNSLLNTFEVELYMVARWIMARPPPLERLLRGPYPVPQSCAEVMTESVRPEDLIEI